MGRCTLENVKTWLEAGQPVSLPAVKIETKASTRSRVPFLVSAAIVLIAVFAVIKMRPHQDQPPPSAASAQSDSQPRAQVAAPAPEPAQDPKPPAAEDPSKTQDQAPATVPSPPPELQAPAPPPAIQASNGPVANSAVIQQVMPDVLPKALASIHGKVNVRVRVTVNSAGAVSDATFESEGPSQYFAKAAMQAAEKWKFKPAQAAPGKWILHFQFTTEGADVSMAAAN
jgi:protein TonB